MPQQDPRIAVIGGGLSGLVAAFRLSQQVPHAKITLLEASDRCGGVIETQTQDGFLLEFGADSFSIQPPGILELCEDLGISDRLIQPLDDHRRAMILHYGQMLPVPEGFALLRPTNLRKIMSSPLLSYRGRVRLLAEQFIGPKMDDEDESLESFALRRFGREVFEHLIQPLVAGIYTAQASQLSMKATMPQFVEFEKQHGGMIKATRALRKESGDDAARSASGARYGQFRSFPNGMVELFDALIESIGSNSIRLSTAVSSISRNAGGGWLVENNGEHEDFDAVVLTTSTEKAAHLLNNVHSQCAAKLSTIPYASSAVVLIGARSDQIEHPLDSFGLVIPAVEERRIIAASFADRKFAGRSPDDHHLIRVFIGGATQPELLDHSDDELIAIATQELRDIIGLQGVPVLQTLHRWNNAMPQYHVGHCDLRDSIEEMVSNLPGLELAGNGLHGVGIAHCVRTSTSAAKRLVDSMEPEWIRKQGEKL